MRLLAAITSLVLLCFVGSPATAQDREESPTQRRVTGNDAPQDRQDKDQKQGERSRQRNAQQRKNGQRRVEQRRGGQQGNDQRRGGRQDNGQRRGGGGGIFKVLDVNRDGQLSRAEINNAVAVLMKLDVNKDGKLDAKELAVRGGRGGKQQRGGSNRDAEGRGNQQRESQRNRNDQ